MLRAHPTPVVVALAVVWVLLLLGSRLSIPAAENTAANASAL